MKSEKTKSGAERHAAAHADKIRSDPYWRGQAAGALCGECTPLHKLDSEDRADPEFMRGYLTEDKGPECGGSYEPERENEQ